MPEPSTGDGDDPSRGLSLAIADINWFTTESLFREIRSPAVSMLGLRCLDYLNGWRQGIYPWSPSTRERPWGQGSRTRAMILPSGWMKRFPRLGMRPIARAIRKFWDGADPRARRGLVLTYPHYLYLRDQLAPDAALYYNIDDYALYWPRHAEEVKRLERQMVLRTDATICVARRRADELRDAIPEAAEKIHHIPHGTPRAFLAPEPLHRPAPPPDDIAHLPRPLLGYIGSIGPRVDWRLLRQVALAMPGASLVLVGREPEPDPDGDPWLRRWADVAALANVHHLGLRTQSALPDYYASFDVNLIPYAQDDAFNRACSPTKIMDGLGSSRPMVSTAIPECRLYSHLFDVVETAEEFVAAARRIVAADSDDGRAEARLDHALANLCEHVAARVLATLDRPPAAADRVQPRAPASPAAVRRRPMAS